jgi:hypothetical protein
MLLEGLPDVRVGSKAVSLRPSYIFRFAPESGQIADVSARRFRGSLRAQRLAEIATEFVQRKVTAR